VTESLAGPAAPARRSISTVQIPYRNVLFICHANTSRSIIAAALLRKMLGERSLERDVTVRSAGIAPIARDGALVSIDARYDLRDVGNDLPPDSCSTDLKRNRHLVDEADLILAMTGKQIDMLCAVFPEAAHKRVYTLKEFAGGHGDIEDPSGRDENFFAACRDEINDCLERAIARFVP
jgi:protein-tyrosine-phosphatase